jgi:hypothetical protein
VQVVASYCDKRRALAATATSLRIAVVCNIGKVTACYRKYYLDINKFVNTLDFSNYAHIYRTLMSHRYWERERAEASIRVFFSFLFFLKKKIKKLK